MKDDFEVALREEALSDASVKKRITPMISLFYDRVKVYSKVLHEDGGAAEMEAVVAKLLGERADVFTPKLANYVYAFYQSQSKLSLGQIALTDFDFPEISH